MGAETTNGDRFGLRWCGARNGAGVLGSVAPASDDATLRRIPLALPGAARRPGRRVIRGADFTLLQDPVGGRGTCGPTAPALRCRFLPALRRGRGRSVEAYIA